MAMAMLNSGPKLDLTRDNQMFLRYKKWRSKVELIFRSALSKATPEEKTAYLKYWMGDEGLPLVEKWESTGKLDYSNAEEAPLSSGFQIQTYWDLLEEEFKPKGNKLISIIELWTRSKQGSKTLNEWLTYVYNLVEACNYGDSTKRIIRDVLIIGCESDRAKDNIIRRGETITLNETIEILQTEASTNSTLRQFQEIQKKPTASIYYQSYDSRSKKSKAPSSEQNSSSSSPTGSTGSKKECFRCGEPFSRQHMKECKAQDVICNGCGIKGHLKKCCKKSGNFPKDDSNRQNQSSSTGPGKMNIASAAPPLEADFFDERGVLKEYIPQNQQQYQHTGSMFVLKKFQDPNDAILFLDNGVEIQHSVSDPDPAPILSPDFPFQEFPLTEVVDQSQKDSSSISDTLVSRECSNSTKKAPTSTDFSLKSVQNCSSDKEMVFFRDLTVSTAPTQSSRDFNTITIPDNSATGKSIPGITPRIMTDSPSITTTSPVETDVIEIPAEIPEEIQMHSSNYRSVIPTDTQALTALQSLISDDFQAKNTHSTQRKVEETPDTRSDIQDEAFQLIQKIHNQLQQVQWDLQRLHSLHKYKN